MNILTSKLRLALAAVSLAVLAACGGGANDATSVAVEKRVWALRPGEFGIELSAAPIARVGEDYRTLINVGGGTAPYRFEITAGALPPGLTLDGSTGVFQGRPAATGRFNLTLKVTDANGASAIGPFTFTVIEPDAPVALNPNKAAHQAAGRSIRLAEKVDSAGVDSTATLGGAGRVDAPLPGLVGLLSTIPEGSWVMANLNQFRDVWTPETQRVFERNFGGVGSPYSLIAAWSGFAWDSNRGDLILYGGGHANYGGNEVYRWRGSSRVWERASLPSEISQDARGNYRAIDGPDNAPVSAHTYDNNIFLPILDRFLTFGGAAYNNGDAYLRDNGAGSSRYTGPYLWDPSKGDPNKVGGTTGSHVQRVAPYPDVVGGQMWQNRDIKLNLAATPNLPSSHVSGCTGYAVEGGKDVVYVGAKTGGGSANHLFRYVIGGVNNPSTDSWTKLGRYWDGPQSETVCAFDPVQKLFVRVGDRTMPFPYWNVNTPSSTENYEAGLSFTEASGELMSRLNAGTLALGNCGFDFDPIRRQYLLWCGGIDVWALKPPATVSSSGWILQKQPVQSGNTPSTAVGTGILGKWKYISNIDAFMGLQDSTAGNIWIYKPFGWQPPVGGSVNMPPSVTLIAPVGGQTFASGSSIAIQATASDSDGTVSSVEFYDGATKIGTVTQSPWQLVWNGASSGVHLLSAKATDNQNATTMSVSASINVTVANIPPSLTITSPTAGQSFSLGSPVTIVANPVDSDGSVTRVYFFDGATLIGSATQSPWQIIWNASAAGIHRLTAVATDNQGANTTSASISINVNAVNQGPSITLTSPINGQVFILGQPITLMANPSDPEGQIASVQFLDGATVLATLNAAPWQFVVANASLGSHSYSARVTDGAGMMSASASATVQVNPGGAGASTVVLQDGLNGYNATRDSYLYSYWPTSNLGVSATMMELSGYANPLVRFAIFNREGGPVPDNAVITSATLALYKTSYYSATYSANRLLCDWRETEVTWRLCRAGVTWATNGAAGVGSDYASTVDGSGSAAWNPGSWLEIDVTSGLAAMQTGIPNYGWRIRWTQGDNVNFRTFNSRNFTTNVSLRPKLTVDYVVN